MCDKNNDAQMIVDDDENGVLIVILNLVTLMMKMVKTVRMFAQPTG